MGKIIFIIKINFTCFFRLFKNVDSRKHTIADVSHILFLSFKAALDGMGALVWSFAVLLGITALLGILLLRLQWLISPTHWTRGPWLAWYWHPLVKVCMRLPHCLAYSHLLDTPSPCPSHLFASLPEHYRSVVPMRHCMSCSTALNPSSMNASGTSCPPRRPRVLSPPLTSLPRGTCPCKVSGGPSLRSHWALSVFIIVHWHRVEIVCLCVYLLMRLLTPQG